MNFLKMGMVRHANTNGWSHLLVWHRIALVRFTCLYGKLRHTRRGVYGGLHLYDGWRDPAS